MAFSDVKYADLFYCKFLYKVIIDDSQNVSVATGVIVESIYTVNRSAGAELVSFG